MQSHSDGNLFLLRRLYDITGSFVFCTDELCEFGAGAEARRSAAGRTPADRHAQRPSACCCPCATRNQCHAYAAGNDHRSTDTHYHQGRWRRCANYASDHDRSRPHFIGARYTSQSADESIDAVASMSDDGNNRRAKWSASKCKSECKSQFKSEFDESRFHESGRNESNYSSTANDFNSNNSNSNQSVSDELWHAMPAGRRAGNRSAAFDVRSDKAKSC